MLLIGITGSIGSGKSAVSIILRDLGYEVFDADACVHKLYQYEAVKAVGKIFPSTIINGKVDRAALSQELKNDPNGFSRLESIIHPLVERKKKEFAQYHFERGQKVIFFDIPLLFETKQQDLFDQILVVTISDKMREQRVLQRANMTVEKLNSILERQMPDQEKIKYADDVIYNNGTMKDLEDWLDGFIHNLEANLEKNGSQQKTAFRNWNLT